MNKQKALAELVHHFRYRSDPARYDDPDYWTFMRRETVRGRKGRKIVRYFGDCEDFALTLLKMIEGNRRNALLAIKNGDAKLVLWIKKVKGVGFTGHISLEVDGKHADNITGNKWHDGSPLEAKGYTRFQTMSAVSVGIKLGVDWLRDR